MNRSPRKLEKSKDLQRFPALREFLTSIPEEEKDELRRLYREDPKHFRRKMRKRLREMKRQGPQGQSEMRELVEQYHSLKDSKKKAEVKTRIRQLTRQEFEEKMKDNLERLTKLEKMVDKLRDKFETRKKEKQEIIDRRVEELTRDPELKW